MRSPGVGARVRRLLGGGPEPLAVPVPGGLLEWRREGTLPVVGRPDAEAGLSVAFVIPGFRRGSGGHATIAQLVRGLERLGHRCSLWVADDEGRHDGESEAATARSFEEFFGPVQGPVLAGFEDWEGADVCVATGWQTVHRVLRLPGCGARAYLVQDHEPDFHGASAQRLWAQQTYGLGLHCIAASTWLAQLLRERYDASASHFDLGVDEKVYASVAGEPRREDLVVLYARAVTERRAVPLGLLALEELGRRRPQVEAALFGESRPPATRFAASNRGVLEEPALARLYREASVGVVLSLTNPSRLPLEMLACGLPCVDVASESMLACFGRDGPVVLAEPDPLALADAIERLLDDASLREERVAAGRSIARERTWDAAARQVEAGLHEALARRAA